MPLTEFQRELCESSPFDFSDLRALYVNFTLKPSAQVSDTRGLIDVSVAIMETNGVTVDQFRAVDHDLAPGVYPDMREHGAASDDWPELYERVQAADILVLGTPIWLGEKSSVCTRMVERLYGNGRRGRGRGAVAQGRVRVGCHRRRGRARDGPGAGARRRLAAGRRGDRDRGAVGRDDAERRAVRAPAAAGRALGVPGGRALRGRLVVGHPGGRPGGRSRAPTASWRSSCPRTRCPPTGAGTASGETSRAGGAAVAKTGIMRACGTGLAGFRTRSWRSCVTTRGATCPARAWATARGLPSFGSRCWNRRRGQELS
jgi:NADPH-dependent FMN reductase